MAIKIVFKCQCDICKKEFESDVCNAICIAEHHEYEDGPLYKLLVEGPDVCDECLAKIRDYVKTLPQSHNAIQE